MRVKFVECNSYQTAKKCCPWAAKIAKVIGGFMAFESIDDYNNWRKP